MRSANDNRASQEQRERELQALAIKLATDLPGLAPFDYEWETLKPAGLTPEELEWLKARVRDLDGMMSGIENEDL